MGNALPPGAEVTPEILKANGFNDTASATRPAYVLVKGLSGAINYYHMYCVAEDMFTNLSPFLRMLPVTLDHLNHYDMGSASYDGDGQSHAVGGGWNNELESTTHAYHNHHDMGVGNTAVNGARNNLGPDES